MKVLAIDTSSKICGVCILEDEKELYKKDIITERSHSVKLMPIVEDVFKKVNFKIQDIDLIVCDKGPGSFTGIRIGVATAKAFADSLNKPLVGVNSLETLAYNCEENGLICSILDAKNENCYTALFERETTNTKKLNLVTSEKSSDFSYVIKEIITPFSSTLSDTLQILKLKSKTPITFVGNGVEAFQESIINELPDSKFSNNNLLNSYNLGIAGLRKFIANNMESELPLYLKKPQAQRQLEGTD